MATIEEPLEFAAIVALPLLFMWGRLLLSPGCQCCERVSLNISPILPWVCLLPKFKFYNLGDETPRVE